MRELLNNGLLLDLDPAIQQANTNSSSKEVKQDFFEQSWQSSRFFGFNFYQYLGVTISRLPMVAEN